jgi:hypothetical protein
MADYDFTKLFKHNDNPEPEWTIKNINRKPGDTTLIQCGWCEYAGGGTGRYQCMLNTSCKLMKEYGIGTNLYWDTPCIVKLIGIGDRKSILASKVFKIKSLKHQMSEIHNEIKKLKSISLDKKPPLPDNRYDDYREGETVWAFMGDKWNKGIVVPGYRSHDGCVSFVLEDYPESEVGKKGPWGCGTASPSILKDWEMRYFNQRISDFLTWLRLNNHEYNGEKISIEKMFLAMDFVVLPKLQEGD